MDQHDRLFGRWLRISPLGLALACTSNAPVQVTPDATQLGQYLEAHPTEDLQVTDTAGHQYWLHNPTIQNDSLTGVKSREEPGTRVGLGLTEIQALARPEFSTAKTFGLVGGFVATMVTVAVLSTEGDESISLPAEGVQ